MGTGLAIGRSNRQHGLGRAYGFVTVVRDGSEAPEQILIDGRSVGRPGSLFDVADRDGESTPYELILMALGSCTSMTLGEYARRKRWQLEQVVIRLHHERRHRDDVANCGTCGTIDRISLQIYLFGDLDDRARQRLLEIANLSPVYRALSGQIKIMAELLQT